jgi:hypothetical protein
VPGFTFLAARELLHRAVRTRRFARKGLSRSTVDGRLACKRSK